MALWPPQRKHWKKKKQRISPLRFLASTLPRHFAKIESYCKGETLYVHVPGDVVLKRITASANEQK